MTRRTALLSMSAGAAAAVWPAGAQEIPSAVVTRTDVAAESYLKSQITEAGPWQGSVPDEYGMHLAGTASGVIEILAAAVNYSGSKFYRSNEAVERIRLAAGFLERSQSPEGFIDLLSTNFNSCPDTGFVVHNVGTAGAVAKISGNDTVLGILRPFLTKAANGMAEGGIHTPNHRWVVSSALAQVNDLFPNPAYMRRIEQWLAEGIDIDGDGQYTERSTVTYNTICDRAFTVLAAKLKRPELLDPVRKNLRAMMYLLHPDGEVVTEVSRRQDQYVRGTMAGYWFPVQYLAVHDADGQFAALARGLAPDNARLSALIEYPELQKALPAATALPTDYEKVMPEVGLTRIRRGALDATLILANDSRFFTARKDGVVVQAVRFATSFFGKGQFVPASTVGSEGSYVGSQSLSAPYYQPLVPPQKVNYRNWSALRDQRHKTQICTMEQSVTMKEKAGGFDLRIQSRGASGGASLGVPLAIEINLREGGRLEGCRAAPHAEDAWILDSGYAKYSVGGQSVRIGPGVAAHSLTQLRGADPKLPGVSIYLTGYTPFDRTVSIEFS
ncbi:MAG TPA: hypothetical protein VHC90_05370 [Bryobacteraceae bacterium]|nr:hypothetical protein [Bryobacteraceae bacterium]